jgi:fructose-1,6-bisphosphatase/inositol monophosphatase family enzyme
MSTPELLIAVTELIHEVARRQIMPRFGALTAGDVSEKAPGDPVTVADREAEVELTARLTALLPGSVVVGEEAVSGDRGLLAALQGDAPVWIIDPIDGTHNFIDGSPEFCVLVALAQRGELLASWTHAPVHDWTATATKGGGALLNGRSLKVPPVGDGLAGLDVVTSEPRWWPASHRAGYDALTAQGAQLSHITAAGLEYVHLATGHHTALVGVWEFPWDHAAGLLLYAEAGGVVRTADGGPFRLAGGNALPFVCAPDPGTVGELQRVLGEAALTD